MRRLARRGDGGRAQHSRTFAVARVALALGTIGLLGACSGTSSLPSMSHLFPESGNRASAPLISRNGSSVTGRVSFVQRGANVAVFATLFDLSPGPHSIYIHEGGNCSSDNAASAGPVWNVPGVGRGGNARSGDMPELQASGEGLATLSVDLRGLSVGTGNASDIVGHSVVVHDGFVRDPQAQYGVPNGRVACGVIAVQKASE
jgi:Cu-Zn family superoxide dismutase